MATVIYTPPQTIVPYTEMALPDESPTESMADDGARATRAIKCNWADRWRLADLLMHAYRINGIFGTAQRTFFKPDFYPHRQGLFLKNISSIRPVGQSSQGDAPNLIDWKAPSFAVLICEYESSDFDDDTTQDESEVKYADESVNIAAEYMTLPSKKLTWDAGETEKLGDDATASRVIRMIEWELTFTELGTLPQNMIDFAGTVNTAIVTSRTLGWTFGAEQLLYNGLRGQRELFIDGARAWEATMSFMWRPFSWNKFFKPGVQAPQSVFSGGSLFLPYPKNDFTELGV